MKPSFLKLWLANALIMPVFVGGLWVIGIPLNSPMVWIFLAIALPLFTLVAALFGSWLVSNRVDEHGISCSFPFSGRIAWNQVRSVRRQWPFLVIKGDAGATTFLPMRWLLSDRMEFDQAMALLAQKNEMAGELRTKA